MTTATLRLLTPEIVLIAAAVAIYLGGAFSAAQRPWRWIAGAAVLLAAVALWSQHGPTAGRRTAQPRHLGLARAVAGRWRFGALLAALVAARGRCTHCRTARPSTSARCC